MIEAATKEIPPLDPMIVRKLRDFSRVLQETILCRDRPSAYGVSLISTMESSA